MVEFTTGDILKADAEAVVNTVNCAGVMGRGIALQFKKAYPTNFKQYKAACDRGELEPGKMLVHEVGLYTPRYIINFPTKRHWKGKSRLEDIEAGLVALVAEVRSRGIRSIAIPPLGCGLGGLDWAAVRPRIEAAFDSLPDVQVVVYEPAGAPVAAEMAKSATAPKMTHGRAALIGLMSSYLGAVMDPFVTLLEIHKLMYFMQEAGESLKLQFVKGPFGPYSENLRHVMNLLEGHFISGYGDAGDNPEKPIELKTGASHQATEFLSTHEETRSRFERVGRLIDGFETPYGMELLATVHWVANKGVAQSAEAVTTAVHAWNERKKMFPTQHIAIAWKVLEDNGWLRSDSK